MLLLGKKVAAILSNHYRNPKQEAQTFDGNLYDRLRLKSKVVLIKALKAFSMSSFANQCLSVQSEKCFICGFPETVVSSMVNQNILHGNCFSGVSLTFKVV